MVLPYRSRYGSYLRDPFQQAGLTPGEYSNKMRAQPYWNWGGHGRTIDEDLPILGPTPPPTAPPPRRYDPNAPMSSLDGETIGTYSGADTPPPDDWGEATMAAESRNQRLAREAKEARLRADQEAFVRQEAFVDPEHPPPPSSYAQSPHEFDRAIMRSPETLRRLLPYGADASSIALPRPQQDASSLASVFDPGGPPDPFAEALSPADRLRDTAWDTEEPALTDEMRDRYRAPRATRGPSPIPGDPYTPPSPPGAGQPPSDLQPFSQPGSLGAEMERQQREAGERDAAMNPPQRLQPPGRGSTAPNPFEGLDLGGMPGQEDIDRFAGGAGALAPAPGQPQSLPLMSGPPGLPRPRPEPPEAYADVGGPRLPQPRPEPPGPYADVGGPRLPQPRPDYAPPTPAPLPPDVPIATQQVQEEQALLEEAPGTRLAPFSGPAPPLDPALAAAAERAQAPVQQQAQPPPSLDPALEAAKQEARQTLQLHPDTGRIQTAPGMQQFNEPARVPPVTSQPLIRRDLQEAAENYVSPRLPRARPLEQQGPPMPLEAIGSDVLEEFTGTHDDPIEAARQAIIRQGGRPDEVPGYADPEEDLIAAPEVPAVPRPLVQPDSVAQDDYAADGPQTGLEQYQGPTAKSRKPGFFGRFDREHYVGGSGLTRPLDPSREQESRKYPGTTASFVKVASKGGEGKYKAPIGTRTAARVGGWTGGVGGLLLGGPVGAIAGNRAGTWLGRALGKAGIWDPNRGWMDERGIWHKDKNEDDEDKDSKLPSASKADSAKTGGVYGSGGSGLGSDRGSYTGGVYGGFGGRDIGLGVGGAYRNR